ncbi:MAG: glycosyltransferase [Thermomicrobiales bacterium]|nr:glycosyltransferase [Thermomicrobiales bacterium]
MDLDQEQGRAIKTSRPLDQLKVALVHDYLTQYGGAERVLLALHDLVPTAPVFSSVADREALPAESAQWDVRETRLSGIPASKKIHRGLIPLYPKVFRDLRDDLAGFDVVIADSSAWAHHAGVSDATALVCYCHSPARFLYGDATYLGPAGLPFGVRHAADLAFAGLRRSDRRAAARVDRYVANSRNVAARIARVYGRRVTVVYPPIDVDRFAGGAGEPAEWFAVVSRLVPHKRIDLAVKAARRYGFRLKVAGTGRNEADLRRIAGPTVEFLGDVDDDGIAQVMRECRALLLPGMEDFGMTAVEAQAAGRPVIAFRGGGALESVLPGVTGLLFEAQTVESLSEAVRHFETVAWDPAAARANAARFGPERFRAEMLEEIEAGIAARRRAMNGASDALGE